MKKIFAILLLSLSQSGCLVAYAIEGVTDVAIAVASVPVKVGAAAIGDDEEETEE